MSKKSERLRARAADQLRQGRRETGSILKAIHDDKAAILKDVAAIEEWRKGQTPRTERKIRR